MVSSQVQPLTPMLHRHEFIQNHMLEPTFKSRLLGGLWGAVIGDALGVLVEFRNRARLQSDPVTELREYGTHNQPRVHGRTIPP